MVSHKTFDECYFSLKNKIIYLDDIIKYTQKNHDKLGEYENNIFCLECQQAKLSFVHKTMKKRAFLRRNPSSSHKNSRSYNYKYSSTEFSEKYYEALMPTQIKDKLESAMRMLFKDTNSYINKISNDMDTKQNPFIQEVEQNRTQIFSIKKTKIAIFIF